MKQAFLSSFANSMISRNRGLLQGGNIVNLISPLPIYLTGDFHQEHKERQSQAD